MTDDDQTTERTIASLKQQLTEAQRLVTAYRVKCREIERKNYEFDHNIKNRIREEAQRLFRDRASRTWALLMRCSPPGYWAALSMSCNDEWLAAAWEAYFHEHEDPRVDVD